MNFQPSFRLFLVCLLFRLSSAWDYYAQWATHSAIDYEKYLYKPGAPIPPHQVQIPPAQDTVKHPVNRIKGKNPHHRNPIPPQNLLVEGTNLATKQISPVTAISSHPFKTKKHVRNSQGTLPFKKPSNIPLCIKQDYQLQEMLGSGKDGSVYKSLHIKSNITYAHKQSVLSSFALFNLNQEIQILSKLKGTGITSNLHCVSEQGDYFMMEFIEGVTLDNEKLWRKANEKHFFQMTRKMADVYIRLHTLEVVHLDGHLRNWVFQPQKGKLRLIDFGRARDLTQPRTPIVCRMPECKHNKMVYSKLSDVFVTGTIWSIMYVMIMHSLPVMAAEMIMSQGEEWKKNFDPEITELFDKMMSAHPSQRFPFETLKKRFLES